METGQTVQESALHAGRQAWWPLDTMACSLDDDASTISSSFLLGWDPQLCYFGLGAMGAGAGDSGTHSRDLELFVPKCMESPVSEASTAAATGWTMHKDATATTAELDELLMSLWDSDKEHAVGISSCSALNEASANSSQYGDHSDQLSSILPTLPTSPDKTPAPAQAELSAAFSTSHCNADLRTSDTGGAQQPRQTTRANSSSKRSAPEGDEGGESSKRSRKEAPCSTAAGSGARTVAAYPFAVVKPGPGGAGSVTLADINRWILTPPARPVRHPVGEFACAPRVSAGNRPSPSGRTVAGFTRLHTAGRGTITIVRTRG